MRALLILCRILVGATFIISGLVKANDALGFSYKLEEYFAESALGMPWLEPASLALAILACVAEVVLGFAVLVGGRMKLATWTLLLLTLFFGWLTAYTATCDPQAKYEAVVNGEKVMKDVTCVTDCGCFGDAMKGSLGRSLTPWESFTKDMVLLVFVLPIFLFRKRIHFNTWGDDMAILPLSLVLLAFYCWVFAWWFPLVFALIGLAGYMGIKRLVQGVRAEWITAAWITVITVAFTWYCYAHLPLRDYRPYAVGKNIPEEMKGGVPPVEHIFVTYKNTRTGETKEFDSKGTYPWDDSTWVYVDRRIETLKAGKPAPIQDFSFTDRDGVNVGEDILNEPTPVLLVVVKTIDQASTDCLPAIKALTDAAYKDGWYVYGTTSSSYSDVETFRHDHELAFDFLTCDEITLKTMIRSNPGVILLQQGTVRGQWHCNDVPTLEEAKKKLK
ncbi:MAG: DoxX family protein [Bacteroidetes bacterium]|nr:DoxX family protein [Bacteroidota bacterium]